MQRDLMQKWTEYYQGLSKPASEIVELNIKTLNKLTKNSEYFDDFIKAKKPEDIISAQIQLANTASHEALEYMQEFYGILLDAAKQHSKIFTEAIHETTKKAESQVREARNR